MKSLKHTIQESLNEIEMNESLRIGYNDKPENTISDIFSNYDYEIKQEKNKGNTYYVIYIVGKDYEKIYEDICDLIKDSGTPVTKKERQEMIDEEKIIASLAQSNIYIETKIGNQYFQMRLLCSTHFTMNIMPVDILYPNQLVDEYYEIDKELFNEISTFIHDNDETALKNTILI